MPPKVLKYKKWNRNMFFLMAQKTLLASEKNVIMLNILKT